VLVMLLGLRWRYNLTRTLHSLYFSRKAFYRVNNMSPVDNVDARLSSDLSTFIKLCCGGVSPPLASTYVGIVGDVFLIITSTFACLERAGARITGFACNSHPAPPHRRHDAHAQRTRAVTAALPPLLQPSLPLCSADAARLLSHTAAQPRAPRRVPVRPAPAGRGVQTCTMRSRSSLLWSSPSRSRRRPRSRKPRRPTTAMPSTA
jgi:hypothetical protein